MRKYVLVILTFILTLIATPSFAKDGGRWVNFRIFPINAIVGEYIADLSVAPLNFLSLGVIGYSADVDLLNAKAKGNGYGGRLTIHFSGDRFSQGWFLTTYYVRVPRLDVEKEPIVIFGPADTLRGKLTNNQEFGALLGKMWMWKSGFNTSLALGARKYQADEKDLILQNASGTTTSTEPYGDTSARVEFTMGWAF